MSKAFTRESDDAPEPGVPMRPLSALPPGAKNYLTPEGHRRLQAELLQLITVERPRLAAGTTTAPETRRSLQNLDQQIRRLEASLRTATVVPAPEPPWDQVRFGATVMVRHGNGEETTYRLVGLDETDLDRNWVSWLSPIAKALLNARLGQRVRFKFPSGEEELVISQITYE